MFLRKTTVPIQGLPSAPSKSPSYKPTNGSTASTSNNHHHHPPSGPPGLPVLGRMDPSHISPGTKVWLTDAKVLWRIGEVQSVASDQHTAQVFVPDAAGDSVQTVALTKLYAFDPSHIVNHDDIAHMNNMHEAPLLNVLRQRFEADKIYTFTADILLSINPYKTIPLLYDVVGFMDQYSVAKAAALTSDDAANIKRPPHLFTIAEKAYCGMKGAVPGSGTSQSIIVSGESGAGKTEASKYIMKYLATASKHAAQLESTCIKGQAAASVHEKIEGCVVLSNLILESFGNAKTSRNDNSSRFGKYIQIHYNTEGRMAGVSIRHFLLEKTRLVMPQANERNYHIFYQLLAGLKTLGSAESSRLKLTDDVWNYIYLTRGDCVDVDGVDDAAEFEQLCACMDQLGMGKSGFQAALFELLAAILHLGNLQFESAKSNNDETTIPHFPEASRGVHLELVASLLGVDSMEFAKKMVTQTTVTGRGSILEMKLSPEQAKNAMDAFCKYLYGELFHHLIGRINKYANDQTTAGSAKPSAKTTPSPSPFIGILDIFGFEVMKKNSLEQLCINFTNETLQQQFNKHVFVLEQERYASEGIAFSTVEYKDNQLCLDLIQKPPLGLLPLLEEQMLLKRKTTDKQLLTIYHGNHLDKHAHYTKPRFECDEFVVRHYAGEVTYDINEFIAKNTDNLHDDLLDLLKRSDQPLLKALFSSHAELQPAKRATASLSSGASASSSSPVGSGGKRTQGAALTGTTTVSSRFRTQLGELMDVLWHTSPNYIKCIKPNNLKFPGGFSCELVRDQLIYSGVLEVVRIRQEGFPIRKRFEVFYELFWQLASATFSRRTMASDPKFLRTASEAIAHDWLVAKHPNTSGKRPFAMGRHEVFLRYGQVEKLEAYATALRSEKALRIQSRLLGWRARKKYKTIRQGVVQCQALYRMRRQKAQYTTLRTAALVIQTKVRGVRVQRRFRQLKHAANVLFRSTLRFLTHKQYHRWAVQRTAAIQMQKIVRGYLMRTAADRHRKLQLRSSIVVQSWYKMTQCRRVYVRLQHAAIRVQAAYRAVVTRRRFLCRRRASIVMAAFVRQCMQRRKFRSLKHRIVKLQAMVRQWKHRLAYRSLRKAVVILQNKRRQHLAMAVKTHRVAALRVLQHAMRGWRQRCEYLKLQRSARTVQYVVKRWRQQKEFRLLRAATKRIQICWRQYFRTQAWQTEVALLFRTPGGAMAGASGGVGASSPSSRSHSKMEDSDRRVQKLRANPLLYCHLRPKAYGYNTLFLHAAGCGDFHVIKFMLDATPQQQALFDTRNARGHTAFHEACAHGQYDMAKFLLQAETKTRTVDEKKQKKPEAVVHTTQTEERPEQDVGILPPVGLLHQGFLKKRRETSRWMKRFVVLTINENHTPQLAYYANDKPATLQADSAKSIDLSTALFKKSMDVPFAFEIHSPQLLHGRNKEGRLYFAAENEMEIQKWLAQLRNVIPSSIESRLFAMHRGHKHGAIEFVDFALRKAICSRPVKGGHHETPLHLVAGASISSSSTLPVGTGSLLPGGGGAMGHSSLEIAVSASAISVTIDEDHNNQRHSHCVADESIHLLSHPLTKSRTEVEAELVKTALWLVENGADINALTVANASPIKLALHARNYLVAKYLLDRGALASGLSETELDDLHRIKAALTKNAISSVCGSSASSGSSSRTSSARALPSLGSFSMKRSPLVSSATSDAGGDAIPILFLQKQPGKVRHSSYVSVFVELVGISNPQYLSRPRIIVSVLDAQSHLVEAKQQVSVQPLVMASSLVWSFTWHMQTPLENLPHGACVVLELTISPTLSSSSGAIAGAGAQDFVPVCWTYFQVDQRTANSMALTAEMYKYPMDLTLTKLQHVDAFVTGDMFISQGPQ